MTIKLTHANTKQEIYVATRLVFAYYYSESNRCTHVLAAGGAILPVKQSPDEIRTMMSSADPLEGSKQ